MQMLYSEVYSLDVCCSPCHVEMERDIIQCAIVASVIAGTAEWT